MTCDRIDERLLALTAADPVSSFSADESEHLGRCARCRERRDVVCSALALIAGSSAERSPGPSYWSSVPRRVRERTGVREPRLPFIARPAVVRAIAPAAAIAVLAFLFSIAIDNPPDRVAGGDAFAALTGDDLYELRQSGKDAGLLEPADQYDTVESSVAEFIADLLPEEGARALAALADPEDLLRHVDDEQFAEIVSSLDIN